MTLSPGGLQETSAGKEEKRDGTSDERQSPQYSDSSRYWRLCF